MAAKTKQKQISTRLSQAVRTLSRLARIWYL